MDTPAENIIKEIEIFNKRFKKVNSYLNKLYNKKEKIEYKIANVEDFQQVQMFKAESAGLKWDYNTGMWVKLDG